MFTIRPVQPHDLYSVIKIAYESLPERYNPTIFTTFYESFPKGFLIAVQHHKIIGFLIGVQTQTAHGKILMLSVDKQHRRKGVGSALLSSFFNVMTMNSILSISLEVRMSNSAAIAFYQHHGFVIQEKIQGFYQNGSDAYSMKKQLQSN